MTFVQPDQINENTVKHNVESELDISSEEDISSFNEESSSVSRIPYDEI